MPVPFPRLAFINGEGRTPDGGFRVALIPVKFHDNGLTGEDLAGEKFTNVAVERTDFPAVQFYRVTIGPINCPQARLRLEQPQGETFKGLTVELGGENIEIAKAPQNLAAILCRVEFNPFVTAGQGFFQFAVLDLPSADQKIKVVF